MKTRNKFAALLGAGALLMALAGTAFAATTNVDWTGNGVDKETWTLNTVQCDNSNTAYLYWVLSPADGVTAAELWINGVDQGAMEPVQDNGHAAYKLTTGWFDLETLEATAAITYSGDLSNGLNLKISHGCPGVPSSSPSFGLETAGITDAPSATPTFGLETAGITDAPTEPTTDALGTTGTSGPADGAWMLVVALGVLLASIVVLTPARAKGKR